MLRKYLLLSSAVLVAAMFSSVAIANEVIENFDTDSANWQNSDNGLNPLNGALNYYPTGGIGDSGYISEEYNFASFGSFGKTGFRAEDGPDASNDAFVGDWHSAGYNTATISVRHNAPVPVVFYLRVASSANFPGAGIENGVPVAPGAWTELTYNIAEGSPQITYEGPYTHSDIFGDVGNFQIGISQPAGYETDTTEYSFDLDQVVVGVPEPSSIILLIFGLLGTLFAVRRHS